MEHILEVVQPYGMLTAGALFGAGWWCWCDVSACFPVTCASTPDTCSYSKEPAPAPAWRTHQHEQQLALSTIVTAFHARHSLLRCAPASVLGCKAC
jgi:hypothetical protein